MLRNSNSNLETPRLKLEEYQCPKDGAAAFKSCLRRLEQSLEKNTKLPDWVMFQDCLINHREQHDVMCSTYRYNLYSTYQQIGFFNDELKELSQVCMGNAAKTILMYSDGEDPGVQRIFWNMFYHYKRTTAEDIYFQYCNESGDSIHEQDYYRGRFVNKKLPLEFDRSKWCNDDEFYLNITNYTLELLGEGKFYTPSIYVPKGLNNSRADKIEDEFNLFTIVDDTTELPEPIDPENLDLIYSAIDSYEYGDLDSLPNPIADFSNHHVVHVSMSGREWIRSEDHLNSLNCTNGLYYCNHNSIAGGLIRKYCPLTCKEVTTTTTIYYGILWCPPNPGIMEKLHISPVEGGQQRNVFLYIFICIFIAFISGTVVLCIKVNKTNKEAKTEDRKYIESDNYYYNDDASTIDDIHSR